MERKKRISNGKITWISGFAVVLFVIVLFVSNLINSNKIINQIESMREHPLKVIIASGNVETYIKEMRIHSEKLLYNNNNAETSRMEKSMESLYPKLEKSIKEIEEKTLVSKSKVRELKALFSSIKKEHSAVIDYGKTGNRTYEEMENFQNKNLNPLYSNMENLNRNILDLAENKFNEISETAMYNKNVSVFLSIAVLILTLVAVAIYQYFILKQHELINYKNKLFDIVSKNIDNAFYIKNLKNEEDDYISDNIKNILGFDGHELLSSNFGIMHNLIDKKDKEYLKDLTEENIDSNWSYSFIYTDPNTNEKKNILLEYYYVRDKDIPVVITVFTDETESKNMQRKLENALDNAERASIAKSEFLSRMSHEIRTPLNGITGMTLIAIQNIKDEKKELDCLNKISMSSKHLLVLVNDVLDMAKIESGKVEIKNEKFNFRVFIESITSIYFTQAKARNIDYETILIGDIPEQLNGDSLRLNQILGNLLSNALKFTPENGKIKFKITLVKSSTDEDILKFEVIDNGCGIKKENADKIFNAFEQEDDSITKRYGGTGLGLSISKRFAHLMGGEISVKSKEGEGSDFIVQIPFKKVLDQKPIRKSDLGNLNVLVVDDDIETCTNTKSLLNKIGLNADWVDNGFDAIKKIERSIKENDKFDVCLIDWKMPYIDGIETTRRIREIAEDKDILVILITAYDVEEIREEALRVGANGVINKPLFESTIVEAIENAKNHNETYEVMKDGFAGKVFAGKRILIAEDNDLNLEIASELMVMNGAEVEKAKDGKEAVDMFAGSKEGYYDLILMDIQMPVMNGYEATKEIRKLDRRDAKTVSIVAMSANVFESDVRKSIASGMNDHIGKPINMDEIYDKLGAQFS
ncbi:response regulator [Anaerofustis stercorihominis]|uniref:Circadian input-output histidine kinase CikA n=1 Tax=Anaerofustis stercorihominis TaxID=214853 RepID=A0A3E3DYL6_9FIRM|nr:response regulator [Anaerofustis stercorihominis]RGD74176.1 response regulator [Anaerofustis stercorihominis]